MKILVLSREFPPYVLGGISYHLRNLYNEIAEKGHEITILAGKCPQSWEDAGVTVSGQIKVNPVEFGFRKGYYLLYPLALRKRLLSINTDDFDLAVAHTPLPFQIPDLPLITKYHDCVAETRQYMRKQLTFSEKIGDSLLHPFRRLIDQRSLLRSDYTIFNSHVNKEGWTSNYDFDDPYSVIHNGVDTEIFSPISGSQERYVLFVGTTEQKGLGSVIEYANRDRRPVHIVGEIKIDHSNIICHGRVSQKELRELYAKAAVTIHPARFESFGNAVLESLACGTPVVTTPKCGASEVLTDETGVVTDSLHEGVEEAVTFSPKACRLVGEKHKWSYVSKETLDVFKNVGKVYL